MRKATERKEGLGKNATLSNYEPGLIYKFLEQLPEDSTTSLDTTVSPSQIIVEELMAESALPATRKGLKSSQSRG